MVPAISATYHGFRQSGYEPTQLVQVNLALRHGISKPPVVTVDNYEVQGTASSCTGASTSAGLLLLAAGGLIAPPQVAPGIIAFWILESIRTPVIATGVLFLGFLITLGRLLRRIASNGCGPRIAAVNFWSLAAGCCHILAGKPITFSMQSRSSNSLLGPACLASHLR